jgi:rhamnose utilization protein RhaD (predicted bifunctional aldolase and dehydrogenase)/NAD(P)-dependent dehydrogenase (short-subunit alcohol dehydrogenase family)
MKNSWDEQAAPSPNDPLGQCVYASRLLGSEPSLVLHGGGNTSVKSTVRDVTGAEVEVLHVKGSGWDLATIEEPGFAPLRLDRLRALLELESLTDSRMMNELRCALLDAAAPDPSVESLLHALIPDAFVLHTHADAVLTLTNLHDGEARIREVYGDDVLVVPYVMPGFDLAKRCRELIAADRGALPLPPVIVLLRHGVFTYGPSAKAAYDRMIDVVDRAERYIRAHTRPTPSEPALEPETGTETGTRTATGSEPETGPKADLGALAELRRTVSHAAGTPLIATRVATPAVMAFCRRADLASVANQGPATPDHVIRTKRTPLIGRDVERFVQDYTDYFDAHVGERGAAMLDPAPRVVLDPELGMVTFGRRAKDADIAADVYCHTMGVIGRAEQLGGYRALPPADVFDVEYWELEQAKLRRSGAAPEFAGEVALVTGAASGIGRACALALLERGAVVVGLDVDPAVHMVAGPPEYLGVVADLTRPEEVDAGIRAAVERFGGVDILVAAAGVFGRSEPIAALDTARWQNVMAINVDAFSTLLAKLHGLLAAAPRYGRVVLIGSKNAAAPGPGAAAYSVSKAAATQLARVAALEWAADGIRVNVVHPDAVFDTGLWTPELIRSRAEHYGLTPEQYKQRNLLGTEVTSAVVGRLVADLCGPSFRATTGAQIPVDGGSDRII